MGLAAAVGAMTAAVRGSEQMMETVEYETAVEYLSRGKAKTLDEFAVVTWNEDALRATMAAGGAISLAARGARNARRYPWAF